MTITKVSQSNQIAKSKREKLDIKKLKGQVFGRLTIIGEAEPYINPTTNVKSRKVTCICECGITKSFNLAMLKFGHAKSCGCFHVELLKKRAITHGQSSVNSELKAEYKTWQNIKIRTTNQNSKDFKNYGGRGIKMSDEWLNSFETFFADMGKRPSPQHSIERRNVNDGYSKDNCYWATRHQQAANTRKNSAIKTIGVRFSEQNKKWVARLYVNGDLVLCKYFNTEIEAIKARKEAEEKYAITYN